MSNLWCHVLFFTPRLHYLKSCSVSLYYSSDLWSKSYNLVEERWTARAGAVCPGVAAHRPQRGCAAARTGVGEGTDMLNCGSFIIGTISFFLEPVRTSLQSSGPVCFPSELYISMSKSSPSGESWGRALATHRAYTYLWPSPFLHSPASWVWHQFPP